MAVNIVTGKTGQLHITSDDDRYRNAAYFGKLKRVFKLGREFEYQKLSDNLVRIFDGMLMNQGTQIAIEPNGYEDVTIDNGITGTNRNDIIVMRYTKSLETGLENATLFVVKGTSGATAVDPVITSGNILDGGDLIDDMPLYRVKIESTSIATIETLFELIDPEETNLIAFQNSLSNKMDKINPSGTGTLSVNRDPTSTVGNMSIAIGDYTEASGDDSVAIGNSALASGDEAIAIGSAAQATGERSFAFGYNAKSNQDDLTALGKYNDPIPGDILEVGNGTLGARSNAFRVTDTGEVYNGAGEKLTGAGAGERYLVATGVQNAIDLIQFNNQTVSGLTVNTNPDMISLVITPPTLQSAMSASFDISNTFDLPKGKYVIGFYTVNIDNGVEIDVVLYKNATEYARISGGNFNFELNNDISGLKVKIEVDIDPTYSYLSGATIKPYITIKGCEDLAIKRHAKNNLELENLISDKMDKINAKGSGSFSLNRDSSSTIGTRSVAIGLGSVASDDDAVAIGSGAQALDEDTIAIGVDVVANSDVPYAFGQHNDPIAGDLVEFGNGRGGAPSNALRIKMNGDVIGGGDFYDGNGDKLSTVDTIGDLSDVDINSPSNGEILSFNSSTNKWENATGGGGGGGASLNERYLLATGVQNAIPLIGFNNDTVSTLPYSVVNTIIANVAADNKTVEITLPSGISVGNVAVVISKKFSLSKGKYVINAGLQDSPTDLYCDAGIYSGYPSAAGSTLLTSTTNGANEELTLQTDYDDLYVSVIIRITGVSYTQNISVIPFTSPKGIEDFETQEHALNNLELTQELGFIKKRINLIPYPTPELFGIHLSPGESDPEELVVPLNDAVGMTPARMNYNTGVFDYGSWADVWFVKNCKPCILGQNGQVIEYLDKNDLTKDIYGNNVIIDSTLQNANVMIEFPKIWFKAVPNTYDYYFSPTQIDSDYKDYAYIDYQGIHKDHFYMPAFNGSLINGIMRSVMGEQVSKSLTGQQEIDACAANGNGWYTEVACDIILINFLLTMIGQSTDTQNVFGQGLSTGGTEAINDGFRTGVHFNKGMFYGTNNGRILSGNYGNAVKVFGIENYWGFQLRRYAGDMLVNGNRKVKMCYSTEDGSSVSTYNSTGNGYVNIGATPSGINGGYIDNVEHTPFGIFAKTSNGSSSTYFCDGMWYDTSNTCYALHGGNSHAILLTGVSYLNLAYSFNDSGWNIGTTLSFK